MMPHERSFDAAALSAALAIQAMALAAELLPAGRRAGSEWRAGSLAGEPGQSLGVHLFGPKAGLWADFASEETGDALDLVAAVLFGGDLRPALDWARTWLGLDGTGAIHPVQRRAVPSGQDAGANNAARLERAREAWCAAIPVGGSPAGAYLAARALAHLAGSRVLRWGAAVSHPEGGRNPAMLAMVQDVAGQPVGIHRTYLTLEGVRARHLSPGKASLGPIGGGAIRLQPARSELVVGEGIESSASAGLMLSLPAWAALSTSGLHTLMLPGDVRHVVIAADPDPPGEAAAQAAAARWTAEGRDVRIARPAGAGDFNDVLVAMVTAGATNA